MSTRNVRDRVLKITTSSALTRRLLAAPWFGLSALLATFLYFQPLRMGGNASILFIVAPALAGSVAGFAWGAAILSRSDVNSYAAASLRGMLIGIVSFCIFAVMFACLLPIYEGGWSLRRVCGLAVLTLTLGAFMGGPLSTVSGMISSLILLKLRHHFFER